MFHPMIAGVTIPGVGLIMLIFAPYIDKNPSNKPEDRKFAISLMTIHLMFWAVLVIIGSFFRGPGFNFTLPWVDGIVLRAVIDAKGHRPMSAAAVIAIAVGVVGRARRAGLRHAGPPLRRPRRRRAVQRDPPPRPLARETRRPSPPSSRRRRPATSRRRARVARCGTAVEPARDVAPVPWTPPDPEAIGVSRRMFFNRATVTLTSAGLGAFSAAGFVAFLWPTARAGSARTSPSASSTTSSTPSAPGTASSTPRPPGPGSPSTPPTRCRRPRPSTTRASSPAWSRASSRCTRSARTSAAGCRRARPASGSSARATARSTTASARRRPALRPRHGPLPGLGRRQRRRHRRHRHHRHRPADRHQHDRPGGRGPALHHRRG